MVNFGAHEISNEVSWDLQKRCVCVLCVYLPMCVVSTKEKFSFKKSTPHSLLGVVGATFIYVDHNLWLFALLVFSCLVWRKKI